MLANQCCCSNKTASARNTLGKVDGMLAPFGFTDNVEIALSAEAHSQTAAHLRYIVDGHDADRAHRSDLNDQYGTTPTSGTARRQISPLPFGRGRSSMTTAPFWDASDQTRCGGSGLSYSCIRVGSSIRGVFQPATEGGRQQI